MSYNGFAIDQYLDAAEVTRQLDELIKKPVWSIRRDKLAEYVEHYFDARCPRSKAMISQAKKVIPGGVQHNLAFNYPFPIVITRAEGAKLWDIDGNWYYDLLQAGGPTILGSNVPAVRDQVIELLNTCGPSTGLFHEFEYKLAKKVSDLVPSVEMFRMLGSGTEADMCAARIARLKTGHKNILKMGGAYHGWSDQLAYGMRVPGTKGIMSKGVPNFVFKHTDEFFPNDLEDLERKLRAVETALAHNRPDPADPIDVLAKVGGFDIAGMCGIFLGGAAGRVPVLMDGFISTAAALCALRLCPGAGKAMLASHVSAEPAGRRLLDALGKRPLITAGMRLGEGTGAVAAIPLLDMALALYSEGTTFDSTGIEAYTPQGG